MAGHSIRRARLLCQARVEGKTGGSRVLPALPQAFGRLPLPWSAADGDENRASSSSPIPRNTGDRRPERAGLPASIWRAARSSRASPSTIILAYGGSWTTPAIDASFCTRARAPSTWAASDASGLGVGSRLEVHRRLPYRFDLGMLPRRPAREPPISRLPRLGFEPREPSRWRDKAPAQGWLPFYYRGYPRAPLRPGGLRPRSISRQEEATRRLRGHAGLSDREGGCRLRP